MSVQEHNPFKVGDKVKVKAGVLRTYPCAFKNFLPVQYAVVTKVEYNSIFTDVEDTPTHFEHFEFYKEEKDMNQQAHQKTKRVPFTRELWEKWKDGGGKVVYKRTGKQVLQFAYFPEADRRYRCVYLTLPGTSLWTSDIDEIELEIPVTTKRIPFNPELKNAKVFVQDGSQQFNLEAREWRIFSNGTVALMGYDNNVRVKTNHSAIEMEIEED